MTTLFVTRMISVTTYPYVGKQQVDAAMLYTSDHGEDIFDDSRHLFLHASPVPSYYQLHVPFLIWMSDNYRKNYPDLLKMQRINRQKNISSKCIFLPDDDWN